MSLCSIIQYCDVSRKYIDTNPVKAIATKYGGVSLQNENSKNINTLITSNNNTLIHFFVT